MKKRIQEGITKRWRPTKEPRKERNTIKSSREWDQTRRLEKIEREGRRGGASNDRDQVEDKREPGGRRNNRRRPIEADRGQKVGSREAEGVSQGAGGLRAVVRARLLCLVSFEFFFMATLFDPSLGGPIQVA